jgi:mRNA interferase MazF
VYWGDLDPIVGSEQGGRRPLVIVQNDIGNRFSSTTIVAPVSSSIGSKPYPFQVLLDQGLLPERSVVKCDQVRTIDKSRLHPDRLAVLDEEAMRRVDAALRASFGVR